MKCRIFRFDTSNQSNQSTRFIPLTSQMYLHTRRKTIPQTIFIFLALLITSAATAYAATDTIKARRGMNLVGQVNVDGKPRQGVVVSDGKSVVTTDAQGIYQMHTAGRQHVFISVPPDCEIPLAGGLPLFYATITENPDSAPVHYARRDFELKSAPVKRHWSLMVIADPQVGTPDITDFRTDVMPRIREMAPALGPDTYAIALGDLVWNAPHLYDLYKEEMGSTGIPTFAVIGNHDHNEYVHCDTHSDREFRTAMGPTYYSVNIGDCHLVALDDVLYSGARHRNDYEAHITQQQLDWLRQDLAHVDTAKTVIVGFHIPTSRRNAPWHVDNADSLYTLLRPFHDAQLISGHTHYNFTTDIEPGIRENTFAAAMGAFWYPLNNDGSPRGIAVMEFDGPTLVNRYYQGEDTPRSFQMKIYGPDRAALWNPDVEEGTPSDQVLVNIFLWHHDWTVEVSEDGDKYYTLTEEQRLDPARHGGRCWDPEVRSQLVDGKLPANHGGSRPADLNDHMFLFTPKRTKWKKITVRATDPFGNVYTDTLKRKPQNTNRKS